jgi:hypothetical protein
MDRRPATDRVAGIEDAGRAGCDERRPAGLEAALEIDDHAGAR